MKTVITVLMICISIVSNGQQKDSIVTRDTFDYFSIVDTNYQYYALPNHFKKPKKWKIAEKNRRKRYFERDYPDSLSLNNALAIIDTARSLAEIWNVKEWCMNNYDEVFHHLVVRLSIKTKVGLINTGDLIIWDRIQTGDLKFYGHGGGMTEDIFTIAGRASWILNDLTGEEFAVVRVNMTEDQSTYFKKLWGNYVYELRK